MRPAARPRPRGAVFHAPATADELRLAGHYVADAGHYVADEPDCRAFVNEVIAATLKSPGVDAARVDQLSDRARRHRPRRRRRRL